MNTDIVRPNIGELTKAKKTLEKAKELNRKVKFVPMGYSPSWEREKEVIKTKKEQIDKPAYKIAASTRQKEAKSMFQRDT